MNHWKAFRIGYSQVSGFSKEWIGEPQYKKTYKAGVNARRNQKCKQTNAPLSMGFCHIPCRDNCEAVIR